MKIENDLVWFGVMIGILILLWSTAGGPSQSSLEDQDSIYQTEGSPEEITEIGTLPSGEVITGLSSPYKDKVSFSSSRNTRTTEPQDEYLIIKANKTNTGKINISNWKLLSAVSGKGTTIGSGSKLPRSGVVNPDEAILLGPGDTAYITTGRSPIGVSFRVNICSGYFTQFQDFKPRILKSCPRLEDESQPLLPNNLNDKCLDFVEDLSRCEVITKNLPLDLGGSCYSFIEEKIGYNNCISNHKNEDDFYKNEWRIFLKRDSELWKEKREIIELLDNNNRVVDTINY